MRDPVQLCIVGGGLHGVHLAAVALRHGWVAPEDLLVVDAQPTLLGRFFARADHVGMRHLRSPAVHHLDVSYDALWNYGQARGATLADFAPPYALPSLPLFKAHARHVVRQLKLQRRHHRATVHDARPGPGAGWHLSTDRGALRARNVVLALGQAPAPPPPWARPLVRAHLAGHVLEGTRLEGTRLEGQVVRQGEGRRGRRKVERVVIVGGGISGVQHALALRHLHDVTLVRRSAPDIQRFDADPEWMGPRGLAKLENASSTNERRALIDSARHPGSIPPELRRELAAATADGTLRMVTGEVVSAHVRGAVAELHLSEGEIMEADDVRLATGLEPGVPSSALMTSLLGLGLPIAACGFPLVDETLRWAPGLFVMGRLAELQVGPVAGNLAGARLAAERIEQGFASSSVRASAELAI